MKQDDLLLKLVKKMGTQSWKAISAELHLRSSVQCMQRYNKILKPGLTKGPFSAEEDIVIRKWVELNGACKWTKLSRELKGRTGKQCRERWMNVLDPSLKKTEWTVSEEFDLFYLFQLFGSKWTKIVTFLDGRTENMVKNRFYSNLRRIALEEHKLIGNGRKRTWKNSELLEFVEKAFAEKCIKLREELNLSNDEFKLKYLNGDYFESTLKNRSTDKKTVALSLKVDSTSPSRVENASSVSFFNSSNFDEQDNFISLSKNIIETDFVENDVFVDNEFLHFNNQIDDLFDSKSVLSEGGQSCELEDFRDLLGPLEEAEELLESSKNKLGSF